MDEWGDESRAQHGVWRKNYIHPLRGGQLIEDNSSPTEAFSSLGHSVWHGRSTVETSHEL